MRNFGIIADENGDMDFPELFTINFDQFNENFQTSFVKVSNKQRNLPNVYSTDKNGNPVLVELKDTEVLFRDNENFSLFN